jgi:hypothetical protein
MGVTGLAVFPGLFFFLKTSLLLFFFRKNVDFHLRFYSAFLLLFPPSFLFVKGYFETLQKVIRRDFEMLKLVDLLFVLQSRLYICDQNPREPFCFGRLCSLFV